MTHPRIGMTTTRFARNVPGGDWYVRPNTYDEAVTAAGGLPVSIPAFVPEKLLDDYLDMIDGMLFIGGADLPPSFYGEADLPGSVVLDQHVAQNHLTLVKKVFARNIPVLGICLGMQEINVAFGGKLIRDLGERTPEHRKDGSAQYHWGTIEPGTRLAEIFGAGKIMLNSFHHPALDPRHLARGFRVSAWCGDVIEAIEFEGGIFRMGVQWHPERMPEDRHCDRLFSAFIEKCAKQGE